MTTHPWRHLVPWAVLAFVACNGGTVGDDDDSAIPGDDDTTDEVLFSGVGAALHDEIGSLVLVSWEQHAPADMHVEYSFDEGTWLSSPSVQAEAGPQEHLLLGIPYGADVTYRLTADPGDGTVQDEERSITAGPLPFETLWPTETTGTEAAWDPSMRYLLATISEGPTGTSERYWNVMLDRAGRIVWAVQTPDDRVTLQAQLSHDRSEILIDHNSFWAIFDDGAASQVVRLAIDGTVAATYDTPGLHHPFTEIAGGSLVYGAVVWPGEFLVKLTPEGERETIWSCGDFHGEIGEQNYCGSNTISWHEATDTYLFSFYSTNSVVEIDGATGQTLRYFGHLDGSWTFDPADSAFWWQHGPHYTEDGTLLLSSRDALFGNETVVREYELDEESETLNEIWSFGEGEGIYADEMGEAVRLPGGNTLHNYGSAARLREITPDGTVVWDVTWGLGQYLGRTTPIEDLYSLAP